LCLTPSQINDCHRASQAQPDLHGWKADPTAPETRSVQCLRKSTSADAAVDGNQHIRNDEGGQGSLRQGRSNKSVSDLRQFAPVPRGLAREVHPLSSLSVDRQDQRTRQLRSTENRLRSWCPLSRPGTALDSRGCCKADCSTGESFCFSFQHPLLSFGNQLRFLFSLSVASGQLRKHWRESTDYGLRTGDY
jgi:hypothetical protein